jgi:hypothetical protein
MLLVWVVSNEGFVDNGSHVSYARGRGLPEEVDNGSFFFFRREKERKF